MLVCISPAKKLDWSEVERTDLTQPDFVQEALSLVKTARALIYYRTSKPNEN